VSTPQRGQNIIIDSEATSLEAWEQVETLEAEEKNKIENGVDEARLYIEDLENTLRKQFEEEE